MVENVYCELCHSIIRKLNSCPTKPNFAENTFYENIFELFMVFSSAFPYCLVFLIFVSSLLTKTTRGFFITFLVFFQNFTCEAIKYIYEDPRPEGSCGKGYGFPSSHASFTAALFIW